MIPSLWPCWRWLRPCSVMSKWSAFSFVHTLNLSQRRVATIEWACPPPISQALRPHYRALGLEISLRDGQSRLSHLVLDSRYHQPSFEGSTSLLWAGPKLNIRDVLSSNWSTLRVRCWHEYSWFTLYCNQQVQARSRIEVSCALNFCQIGCF